MAHKKKSTFAAVRWITVATLGKTALQFLQVVVLSRLLLPGDFGLMAIVLAVVTFLQGLADLGVSNAIVHHQDASEAQLSSLYWLNLGTAFVLTGLVIGCSPLAARFYDEPRLTTMLSIAGLTLTASAIGQQLRIRAERELNFAPVAIFELVSASLGFVVAVSVAFAFHSAFALVLGLLASSISLTALSWLYLANGWRPRWYFNWSEIRHFIVFGAYASLSNLVGMVNMQVDIAIGGKMFGVAQLGPYSMARDLSLRLAGITNPVATRIGLPLMAMEHGNKAHVAKIYGRTLEILAALNIPLYLGVSIFSDEIVQVLFGPKWYMAGPLLCILSIWGLLRSMLNPVGALLYACGRADVAFRWNSSLTLLSIGSACLGSRWGATGLAASQLTFMIIVFMPAWKLLIEPDTGMTAKSYLRYFVPSLVTSATTVFFSWLLVMHIDSAAHKLAAAFFIGGLIYTLISLRWNSIWIRAVREIIGWDV